MTLLDAGSSETSVTVADQPLWASPLVEPKDLSPAQINELFTRLAAVENKQAESEQRIAELQERAATAERSLEEYKKTAPVRADEIMPMAMEAFGTKRCLGRLSFAARESIKKVSAYREAGFFPPRFRDIVAKLSDADRKPASREKWSDEAKDELIALNEAGRTPEEIAHIITEKFGSKRLESSIVAQLRKLKKEGRIRSVGR